MRKSGKNVSPIYSTMLSQKVLLLLKAKTLLWKQPKPQHLKKTPDIVSPGKKANIAATNYK